MTSTFTQKAALPSWFPKDMVEEAQIMLDNVFTLSEEAEKTLKVVAGTSTETFWQHHADIASSKYKTLKALFTDERMKVIWRKVARDHADNFFVLPMRILQAYDIWATKPDEAPNVQKKALKKLIDKLHEVLTVLAHRQI